MSGRAKPRGSWRKLLLVGIGLMLVSGVMGAGPAAAHNFTRNDGNDSPGKLDLRSVSVSHTSSAVVHKVKTYDSWTARSLGNDSFFIIQIDKNNTVEGDYERCAFIFYTNRLRGSLTNCGSQFIRYLPVAKLSGTVAKITIPKSQTGNVYWWAVASRWDGPAPCRRGCVDFTPNAFPDMLHDMIPPVVTLTTSPLRVWESSTSPQFNFPFSVSDGHAGIQSWIVQRREVGSASWTFVSQGSSGGSKNPEITGVEGTRFDYRVVAEDRQGNRRISPSRRVYIPTDDDAPNVAAGFSVPPDARRRCHRLRRVLFDDDGSREHVHLHMDTRDRLPLRADRAWIRHLGRDGDPGRWVAHDHHRPGLPGSAASDALLGLHVRDGVRGDVDLGRLRSRRDPGLTR